MQNQLSDSAADQEFPPPPISPTQHLTPILSWKDMHQETLATNVEFDSFWYTKVTEGVAYFFRWLGTPRSTVLVVFEKDKPIVIECRKIGDTTLDKNESEPILSEVTFAFRQAGFWPNIDTQ